MLCRVYGVSRFGFYSWKARGQSKHTLEDAKLLTDIERVFYSVKGVYGSLKIQAKLKHEGVYVGKHRVARIMKEHGLKARCAKIYRCHAKMDRFYAGIKNEIRDVDLQTINQVWLGDVTYLKVNDEWRYLAVILDKYSRRVLGWSLSKKRDAALSLTAFQRAAKKRMALPGLRFHSDRGAEYVATRYQNWLKKHGIIQSMNRKGVMNDNAEMESFFHNFKAERIHKNVFVTDKQLRGAINQYVRFYNHKRLHSSVNYLTPVQYEATLI
ncbi:MAG: hypothetical protein COB26_11980 [Piscirickettsiaceae bacterium]|nr:MAG: hypothetical protein COB26_11980 [Piscirickettsiaceae bacterium]